MYNIKYIHFNFIKTLGLFNMRSLWQARYLLFNWAYSTNHKRISINYFWFVLFAGVIGMVLATIIRLELAYPGVGILAGDSAQYLSIVTAHGVIMVFFMAMPLLFGFLGNFLLPTQMGVHDVAFPRMNSAAFWFLPASLLALCQLVCIDRRYQRMNCFNIRELQSLLRNRFFDELLPVNSLNISTSSSKNAIFNLNFITNRGTSSSNVTPNTHFNLSYLYSNSLANFSNTTTGFGTQGSFFGLNLVSIKEKFTYFSYLIGSFTQFTASYMVLFLTTLLNSFYSVFYCLAPSVFKTSFSSLYSSLLMSPGLFLTINTFSRAPLLSLQGKNIPNFKSEGIAYKSGLFNLSSNPNYLEQFGLLESFNTSSRNLSVNSPDIVYKIKIGNYLPDSFYSSNFDFLQTTFNFKNIFSSSPDWFNSENSRYSIYQLTGPLGNETDSSSLNKKLNFFNFILSTEFLLKSTNTAVNDCITPSLNPVFKTKDLFISESFTLPILFFSQAKQVRILNNWRDLKLHRESWRCRMLSARHQRSLYRRYVNENELIWVVEKNAKDLLPGWAMITPFSSRTRYTLIGKTDIGIAIVAVTLIASMISSANFLMTYRYLSTLNNRKMRDARSFFTESVICASWMMIAANPMLILGLFMLLSDRHWSTSFFDYSGGGDTILFQHMFWFFGHPEVYIIILPCFGITNTLLSFYLRKRISARASLLYSLYTIAFLGFFVWGHHMYMVGLAHTTRMLYSTLTVMISVPAATKLMHWSVTFINSSVHFELPLILIFFFIFYFVSGGISGMAVAHTGMDVLFHDTFYVIGHFHVLLAGSLMFAAFAAFYFYLPSLFGVRYSRVFAYLHIFYYSVGQIFTVIPMIWLGYLGMPRRVLDYPAAFGGWHSLVSSAHMITVSGILAFIIMLFDSLRKQKGYIIKTFGVGRYNTRLNFYLYQIARNRYWMSKHLTFLPVRAVWHSKNTTQVHNLERFETTLVFYTFKKRLVSSNWSYL
jgi:heme/copper-type cytochrome/quinol oxidase subunit 1